MDTVAQRICERLAQATGTLTDIPYPTWEQATESHKELCRELARVSQYPEKTEDKPKAKKAKS